MANIYSFSNAGVTIVFLGVGYAARTGGRTWAVPVSVNADRGWRSWQVPIKLR